MHFLLKRKGGILYFNGHVTYDLPMTRKLILSSKLHYGISKAELRAKKHISRIAGTVLIADYFFFGSHFGNKQISWLNMQNLEWYLADLKSTGKNTIETVEKSLTDMFIRLVRIYPCLYWIFYHLPPTRLDFEEDWDWMPAVRANMANRPAQGSILIH